MTSAGPELDFILQFTLEYPQHGREACVRAAGTLLRLAKQHGKIQDYKLCITPDAKTKDREARIERRIIAVCAPFKLPIRLTKDPRYHTVRVRFPSGKSDLPVDTYWRVPQ
jgi:hypothetical protein